MITLFKSGYWNIMHLFYQHKTKKIHLREIARRTKLHTPTVTKCLNTLEKEGVLRYEREGNLKKYFVERSMRTYAFFQLSDMDRFEKLPDLRKKAIRIFLDSLSKKPVFMILFGSTAKGTCRNDSDIDLLAVFNTRTDTSKAEDRVDALTALKISTFQLTFDSFVRELKLKNDKVVQSAVASGYPLINHNYYYKFLLT